MNNSVFQRLNFVDAIIILTSAQLIFRPILANISIKLPNPLAIKHYDFNRLLKLRRGIHKPKPEPICLDLPDDVIETIISKVDDIVTLRRCTLALSQDAFLPQIVSFSTPLDASLFIPDRSGCWYGRLFNKIVSKSILRLLNLLDSDSVIAKAVLNLTFYVFVWVNMPLLKPQAIKFFQRLSGLKLLELELPAMPCYDCRVSPHLWFKWDLKFGVNDTMADYVLYVFGDKADDSESHYVREVNQMVKALKTVVYHTMFHSTMMDLACEGDDWKTGMTVATKDAERNGGLMIGPQWKRDGSKLLGKILYLPSTLKFNRYTNEEEDPLQVQDVMLLFLAQVDASVDRDDNGVIMACLGDMDNKEGEAEQKTELRQIVAEIIADENCLSVV